MWPVDYPKKGPGMESVSMSWRRHHKKLPNHCNDVIMSVMASQITSLTSVYSTVYSCADQRKHQSPASQAFVRGIHWGPANSLHKWPLTRKMFPFDDVIMETEFSAGTSTDTVMAKFSVICLCTGTTLDMDDPRSLLLILFNFNASMDK